MTLKVAAIIGFPVAQSLSPAMHNAVFRERKLDWSYIAMEVREDALSEVLRTLRDKDIKALSVTMPHKEAVFELLSNASNGLGDVDESARAARSVNTIDLIPTAMVVAMQLSRLVLMSLVLALWLLALAALQGRS